MTEVNSQGVGTTSAGLPPLAPGQMAPLSDAATTISATGESSEPEPRWYIEGKWLFGRPPGTVDRIAGVGYGAIIVGVLAAAVSVFHPSTGTKLLIGVPIALAHPTWAWLEGRALEAWVRDKPKLQREVERAYFKLMTDYARAFWAALLAVYAALLIKG